MKHFRWMLKLVFAGALVASKSVAYDTVLINAPLSATDVRYEYPRVLLQTVLDKTEGEWKEARVETSSPMSRDRTLISLIDGKDIHIMAEAPKPEWEERLIPIHIPIRKGIQGIRLFLIREADQLKFSAITSIEELMAYPTGSGLQWSTRAVMENAGFKVVSTTDYESLFLMLNAGRFDTFGRGVNEIFDEHSLHKDKLPKLAIEKTLALHIPLPTYFYVSPAHPELAKRVEAGLNLMLEDGTFDAIFCQYHEQLLARANMENRRLFCIPNTNLTESMLPTNPDHLLFGQCDDQNLKRPSTQLCSP